jgi:hypothetical protein
MQMWEAERFPHPHSLDYDGGEIISQQNENRETPIQRVRNWAGHDQYTTIVQSKPA